MKLTIPPERIEKIKALRDELAEIIANRETLLKDRKLTQELSLRTQNEVKEKEGTYDLTDDKAVLAHVIRLQRAQDAGSRAHWNMIRNEREFTLFDEMHEKAFAKIDPLVVDLIRRTGKQIAEKLAPAVGEEEAERLSQIAAPVVELEKLRHEQFIDSKVGMPQDMKYIALMKIHEICDHVLTSEEHDFALLKKRFSALNTRLKAAGVK